MLFVSLAHSGTQTKFDRLDVLVNNAGGVPMPGMVLTKEGYEPSFATMHLAHFLLTRQLLPMIEHCHGSLPLISSRQAIYHVSKQGGL